MFSLLFWKISDVNETCTDLTYSARGPACQFCPRFAMNDINKPGPKSKQRSSTMGYCSREVCWEERGVYVTRKGKRSIVHQLINLAIRALNSVQKGASDKNPQISIKKATLREGSMLRGEGRHGKSQ